MVKFIIFAFKKYQNMKNYFIGLSIIGTIFLTFSCKEKSHAHKSQTDSLSSPASHQNAPKKEALPVTKSDFEKIEKLANLSSDTVYVTNYWATWCPPCVQEIPDFVELQQEYKNKTVKFTFVSVDDANNLESEVIPFVKKNKMENVYMMPAQELKKFNSFNPELTQAIPVTIIQKGKNKEGFLGSHSKEFLTKKIEEYLTKK